jgi:hypothetical protein
MTLQPNQSRLPLWLKLAFTAFLLLMVPVYWANYGPTNFLYFCDISLFLVALSLWTERSLPASMAAVGILIPQFLWCCDFLTGLVGIKFLGMTEYMFDARNPLFLRSLSFFHGWLPFLIIFLVTRLGYDRRALFTWTGLGWALCLIAYFFLPPAGAILTDSKIPRNVNYVFGINDAVPQSHMPAPVYLIVWLLVLLCAAYIPTHLLLKRFVKRSAVL